MISWTTLCAMSGVCRFCAWCSPNSSVSSRSPSPFLSSVPLSEATSAMDHMPCYHVSSQTSSVYANPTAGKITPVLQNVLQMQGQVQDRHRTGRRHPGDPGKQRRSTANSQRTLLGGEHSGQSMNSQRDTKVDNIMYANELLVLSRWTRRSETTAHPTGCWVFP